MGIALVGASGVSSRLGCAVARPPAKFFATRCRGFQPAQRPPGRRAVLSPDSGRPIDCAGSHAVRHFCEGGTK